MTLEVQLEDQNRVRDLQAKPLSGGDVRDFDPSSRQHEQLDQAVNGLWRSSPHFSARITFWWRQAALLGFLAGGVTAASVIVPDLTLRLLFILIAIPFACIAIFRIIAILFALFRRRALQTTLIDDTDLPTYSILVPLYKEGNMASQITAALLLLDYPTEKLDVLIVLEADDAATHESFAAQSLPAHFRIITVPHAEPKTKPKALNFALQCTHGDYVVVYDAEDLPAPGQLREAAHVFAQSPDTIACLQARLLIHNPRESWLTRQFSLEYMALFDGLLPAYQSLGVPLPLGGTSNHFPRDVLEHLGRWDPYNVTEDADLGIRLTRLGYQARMLSSETWEEAPNDFSQWLPQRTRWLKGWMQTWLVHARHPFRTLREMGVVAFTGFHLIFGGMVLAALVHPLMYALLIWQFLTIGPFAVPIDGVGILITGLTAFNLAFGYASSMMLCAMCALRRGEGGLLAAVLTLPFYWLLVSAAAWRALWQLLFAPFKWEKTNHQAKI